MVNPKELRIGNWVRYGNAPIQIKNINEGIGKQLNGSGDFYGIDLTNEILESCGFIQEGTEAGDDGAMELGDMHEEKDMSFLYVPKVGRYTEKDSLGLWIAQDYGQRQIKISLKIVKHLHQLQNLVFALTGKELEVNIKSNTNAKPNSN